MKIESDASFSNRPVGRVGDLPPGAAMIEMEDLCVGCGDCVSVCPSALLTLDADGLPRFAQGDACGMCGLCADVCSLGAIRFTPATLAGLRRTLSTEREMAKRLRES